MEGQVKTSNASHITHASCIFQSMHNIPIRIIIFFHLSRKLSYIYTMGRDTNKTPSNYKYSQIASTSRSKGIPEPTPLIAFVNPRCLDVLINFSFPRVTFCSLRISYNLISITPCSGCILAFKHESQDE